MVVGFDLRLHVQRRRFGRIGHVRLYKDSRSRGLQRVLAGYYSTDWKITSVYIISFWRLLSKAFAEIHDHSDKGSHLLNQEWACTFFVNCISADPGLLTVLLITSDWKTPSTVDCTCQVVVLFGASRWRCSPVQSQAKSVSQLLKNPSSGASSTLWVSFNSGVFLW